MTTQTNHCPGATLTLSMMLSETVYRAVINVERIYRRLAR